MKKFPVIFLVAAFFVSLASAKIITVSNNPNSPGQYRRLDSAIYYASNGDILLVSGSVTDYNPNGTNGGSLTINKPLIIYGQGYDPRKDQALVSTISVLHIALAGSGSTISGFSISNLYEDLGTNNITISRCRINNFGYNYGGNGGNGICGSNHNIRENILGYMPVIGNDVGILIQNNILTGGIGIQPAVTNVMITNNYFSSSSTSTLNNATVNNNIFYYKSSSTSSTAYVTGSNCVFNNNIYFNTTNANPLAIGVNNNSGSNNLNANPNFVSILLTSTAITRTDNFNLQAGSPGINSGTDGKNIGPHGGSLPMQYPYSGQPAIPQFESMNILNPVIPSGGTLNVNFKAHSNN